MALYPFIASNKLHSNSRKKSFSRKANDTLFFCAAESTNQIRSIIAPPAVLLVLVLGRGGDCNEAIPGAKSTPRCADPGSVPGN